MKPKIVVTKDLKFYKDQIERLESLGDVTYYNKSLGSSDEWLQRCKGADIICTGMFGFNTEKLYELKDVFISLPFVAVHFLDRKRLKENNIVVSNSPGCNKESVSEWIVGMMIMYLRRLSRLTRTTELSRDEILETTTSLYNKKITILGVGSVGTQLGKICTSLGMEVNFFRRGDDLINSIKDSDVVANCLSTNPTTMGLLNRDFFLSLKKGSFFVSVTSSKVYDIDALKESIDKGILVGAADDAGSAKIGDINDPNYTTLLNHPEIFVTPHIAWNSDIERRKSNDMMIDNIEAWLNKNPINVIE
ncbi:MAG: hydroxyacid dehydrogenase [Candidatus Aenigmarchaeota archaeon]|nr:hydroxyacid dehydrogenase [Candidatus Aenigmarchaeota archaeon]